MIMKQYIKHLKSVSLILIALIGFQQVLLSQNITISGYVQDSKSAETLIGVNMYFPELQEGTTSNIYGFFSLSIPQSDELQNLKVTYLGYEAQEIPLTPNQSQEIKIQLNESAYELGVVEVVAESNVVQQSQMSAIKLPIQTVEKLPALMGEVDIIKSMQLMPGVQSGTEGSSGLYVRGGSPDQNLILLDGVPVYNASHLFGFFSVFNSDAIKNVSLIKGGFPARYGGRLSSVLDISMKEGDMNELKASGNIGLVATKLLIEGPINKGKTSFLVTGRRTYYDLLGRPIARLAGEEDLPSYFFYDLNAKVNHIFSTKDRLYFSLYSGKDQFLQREIDTYDSTQGEEIEAKDEFNLRWGNITSALRWNHLFSNKLFANTTLTYSFYRFRTGIEQSYKSVNDSDLNLSTSLLYQSQIKDMGLKMDFDYYPSPNHLVKFGAQATHHTFLPGAVQYDFSEDMNTNSGDLGTSDIEAMEYAAYAEDEMTIGKRLTANIGVHASGFNVREKNYFSLQPRLSLDFAINENWSTKASYSRMTQYIHLLSNSNAGFPTDLWVPSTDIIKPQQAWQIAGGIAGPINEKLSINIEGYYKKMDQVIDFSQGVNFLQDGPETDLFEAARQTWEEQVEIGEGWTYGGEIFIQKNKGKTTGWIGYTLAWSERQFDGLNFGEKFPYKYDRRHDFSIVVSHQLKENIDVGGSWTYSTGNAITLPAATFQTHPEMNFNIDFPELADYYERRNGFRNKSYHRLDMSINFHKEKKWGKRVWSVGLYNMYSRKNPFYVYFDGQAGNYNLIQASLFPITPSISYKFKFN